MISRSRPGWQNEHQLVDEVEERLAERHRGRTSAAIAHLLTGRNDAEGESADDSEWLLDSSIREQLERTQERAKDDLLRRRATLLRRELEQAAIDVYSEIDGLIAIVENEFRGAGKTQSGRDVAAQRSAALNTLVRRRNAAALHLGYSSYHSFFLACQETSEDEVAVVLRHLERATRVPYLRLLERVAARPVPLSALVERTRQLLSPWADAFSREALLPALDQALSRFGIARRELPITVHETTTVPLRAYCVAAEPGDVHVVVQRAEGFEQWRAVFHEFGHAVASALGPEAYALRLLPTPLDEGLAQLLAWSLEDPAWLGRVGLPIDAADFAERRSFQRLLVLRTHMALAELELRLYSEPQKDLERVRAELEATQLGVTPDPEPQLPSRIRLYTHPFAAVGYLLGDCIANQLYNGRHRWIAQARRTEFPWSCGARYPWPILLRRAIGTRSSPRTLAVELADVAPTNALSGELV